MPATGDGDLPNAIHSGHAEEACFLSTNEFGDTANLSYEKLDPAAIECTVRSSKAGAVVSFVGYTRDDFQGKQVTHLEYEAYIPLALKTMMSILAEARKLAPPEWKAHHCYGHAHVQENQGNSSATHESNLKRADQPSIDITRMAVHHFMGLSPPLTPSIVICVSAPHRKEAFVVCEWLLEKVKETVQIWKREFYEDGSEFKGRDGEGVQGVGGRPRSQEGQWKENVSPTETSR